MISAVRIRKLKAQTKNYLNCTDIELNKWWVTKSPLFDGKSPNDMCKTPGEFKKLRHIVNETQADLDPLRIVGNKNIY